MWISYLDKEKRHRYCVFTEAGRYKDIPGEQLLCVFVIVVLLRMESVLYFTVKYSVTEKTNNNNNKKQLRILISFVCLFCPFKEEIFVLAVGWSII